MNIYVQCKGCNSTLEVQDRKSKTREWCSKKCFNTHNKKHNRERNHFYIIKKKFGMTKEEYLHLSKDGCNICGTKEDIKINGRQIRMSVDHCHTTGKARGVLCTMCNRGLGHFKDNINSLKNAITYLNRHR